MSEWNGDIKAWEAELERREREHQELWKQDPPADPAPDQHPPGVALTGPMPDADRIMALHDQAVIAGININSPVYGSRKEAYMERVDARAALRAEVERIVRERDSRIKVVQQVGQERDYWHGRAERAERQRDEALALLRDLRDSPEIERTSHWQQINALTGRKG